MARGWESKGVEEAQQEAAGRRQDRGPDLTPEERQVRKRRASLELDRKRVLQEIAATSSAARRKALEAALAHLEGEIRKLGGE